MAGTLPSLPIFPNFNIFQCSSSLDWYCSLFVIPCKAAAQASADRCSRWMRLARRNVMLRMGMRRSVTMDVRKIPLDRDRCRTIQGSLMIEIVVELSKDLWWSSDVTSKFLQHAVSTFIDALFNETVLSGFALIDRVEHTFERHHEEWRNTNQHKQLQNGNEHHVSCVLFWMEIMKYSKGKWWEVTHRWKLQGMHIFWRVASGRPWQKYAFVLADDEEEVSQMKDLLGATATFKANGGWPEVCRCEYSKGWT